MTLLIVFNDGTERRVENVDAFRYLRDEECFTYNTVDGKFWSWVPKNVIRYIGPEEPLGGISQHKINANDVLDDIIRYTSNCSVLQVKPNPDWLHGFDCGLKTMRKYAEEIKENLNEN